MSRSAVPISLTSCELQELERLARADDMNWYLTKRAQIVLLAAQGQSNRQIARQLGCNLHTASKWRLRFVAQGLAGLRNEPRAGAPRKIGDPVIASLIQMILDGRADKSARLSGRALARKLGISASSVYRIRQSAGIATDSHSSPAGRVQGV